MPARPTLDEIEIYNAEVRNARREGRVPIYKDPRQVFLEDPNRDDYLVEKTEDEISAEEQVAKEALEEELKVQQEVVEAQADNQGVEVEELQLEDTGTADHNFENANTSVEGDLDERQDLIDHPNIENEAFAPSAATEDSLNETGTVIAAPEPMQTIVEQAALQGNNTPGRQSDISTPEGVTVTDANLPAHEDENQPTVTDANVGDVNTGDVNTDNYNQGVGTVNPDTATGTNEVDTSNELSGSVDNLNANTAEQIQAGAVAEAAPSSTVDAPVTEDTKTDGQ